MFVRTMLYMKKEKDKSSERINIRVSLYEKNFIQGLADLYSGGNISLFMIYAVFNCDRKFLEENDLRESNRRKKRGQSFDPSIVWED